MSGSGDPECSGHSGAPSPRLLAGSIAGAAGLIAVVTLVGRAVGLGRWLAFSNGVGATCVGEIYATANQVPNALYEIAAGGALAAVVVPLVSGYLNRGREDDADRTASALLTWAMAALLPLALLVALLARPIASLLLGNDPGCGSAAVDTGATMLMVFAPQIVLYGAGIILSGVLQAHRRFLAAAVAPLLSSLVVIGVYLAYGAWVAPSVGLEETPAAAIQLLAWGTTAGVVALSVPLLVPTWRAGVRLRPTWRFPEGAGRRVGTLAVAGLVAVAAQQVCVLVTVWLANSAEGVGTLNVYTYAQTAYLLPYAVLAVPLATAAFPRLTAEDASPVLRRTLLSVAVAGVVGAVALVAVRREVGALFLALDAGSEGAGEQALRALPTALAWYAPGLVGFALTALLSRALYARGSALAAGGVVALGWLVAAAVPVLRLTGSTPDPGGALVALGLGSSIGMSLTGVLLVLLVRRHWGPDTLRGVWGPALWALGGTLLVLVVRELAGGVDVSHWGVALVSGLLTGVAVIAAALVSLRLGAPAAYRDVVGGIARRGVR
ncbi:murein biosynthesis integral membrane protein MurJ [Ornithinimicrobium faecis]|uniref:murein biosynthesis integral membrane protein MurJ n=1 Tax=Ornithinimicrobium faecis TaxID=2934158 RepID=UPI002118E3CF|nr:lipid II flippase MurJ [Ornithinimicrobium sp. HY1745]